MWNESDCVVVWTFVGIAFLWDWNEIWPFPVLWALQGFPNLLAYGRQHFHSIIFSNFKKFSWIPTLPLALFIVVFHKAHLISHFKMSGSRWMITPPWLSGLLVVMWDTQEAQEYWSQYPSPSPGYLPDPGIKLGPLHWRQILFLFFNWKITALQNFVVFCQTLTWRWIIYQLSYQDLGPKLVLPPRYYLNHLGSVLGLIWVSAHSVQKPQVENKRK